jgi:GABA(A) receptor-associated protein
MTNTQVEKSLEERQKESAKLREKYPERIPIIVKKGKSKNIDEIDKNKFMAPADSPFGQFIHILRKRIKLAPEQALFCFVGKNTIPSISETCAQIYEKYKDEDGFLYVTYESENVFG